MSQIETIMLVTLGFVVAALLALFIGRMVWSYGVNLGKRRTERSAPATIAGLKAERDQLRAESAMQTRKLELRLDDLKTRLAEQTAEVSRNRNRIDHLVKEIEKRDEVISERDGQIEQLNHHVEPLEAELATRTQAMQQLKEQLRDRQDELSSSASGNSNFRYEIAERDNEITRLQEELANREARQQEINIEAETAQERLQSQIRELTALSGQIEKQRSDMSGHFNEFANLPADAIPGDAKPEQQQPAPASISEPTRIKAATNTNPVVKEAKPASSKASPAAKKSKSTAKKAKPSAKKAKPSAKKTRPATKPSAKKAKPTENAIRSEAETAKFASEAIRAAALKPRPAAKDPKAAPENGVQGSILAAMRKKSIGLSGNSPESITRAGGVSKKIDVKVNYLQDKDRDSDRQILDAEHETGQLQDELKHLDAVWATKIAALNKAAPKTVSTRARAATAEIALPKADTNDQDDQDDQPASGRSRQNVISLAARIRALQKKGAKN